MVPVNRCLNWGGVIAPAAREARLRSGTAMSEVKRIGMYFDGSEAGFHKDHKW